MVSVLVGSLLIISIYRCIVDIQICAKAEAWAAIKDYILIIFSMTCALILIGQVFLNICITLF